MNLKPSELPVTGEAVTSGAMVAQVNRVCGSPWKSGSVSRNHVNFSPPSRSSLNPDAGRHAAAGADECELSEGFGSAGWRHVNVWRPISRVGRPPGARIDRSPGRQACRPGEDASTRSNRLPLRSTRVCTPTGSSAVGRGTSSVSRAGCQAESSTARSTAQPKRPLVTCPLMDSTTLPSRSSAGR